MSTPIKASTLSAWRLRHARLTQQEAADRARVTHRHGASIESNPSRATVGALASYVQACGGKLECFVEIGGVRRLLVLLAMLVACGGVDGCAGLDDDGQVGVRLDCSRFRCDPAPDTFTADASLGYPLGLALDRIRRATGRTDLHVAPGGIPVSLGDGPLMNPDGHQDCAQTVSMGDPHGSMFAQSIEVDRARPDGCWDFETQLLHELIHALAPHAQHTASGLFASAIQSKKLDEQALERLCIEFACADFVPEVLPEDQ